MNKEQSLLLKQQHWLLLKQLYPISRKFWGKVGKIRPFGILIEVDDFPKDSYKYVGVIEIFASLYKEDSQQLPSDSAQWPQEGTYIDCIVCDYREYYDNAGQLSLSWLGKTSQS